MTIKTHNINTLISTLSFDEQTVISLFESIRNICPQVLLLEGADYIAEENSYSYICAEPIAEFKVEYDYIIQKISESFTRTKIERAGHVLEELRKFKNSFEVSSKSLPPGCINGLFGYLSYDSIRHFENLDFPINFSNPVYIPEVFYNVYRWIICIDHYHNKAFLLTNCFAYEMEHITAKQNEFTRKIKTSGFTANSFSYVKNEQSELDDDSHLELIANCKKHIFRGDVFQIVGSRRFSQSYQGDDFQVYRALRRVNPSPYMFYLDTGSFRLFGSSPEAELIIDGNAIAELHPIAGTVLRSGDSEIDLLKTQELIVDPKENAEHVMLVDLARNDLSRHCHSVKVKSFKEVQNYSHVIHLVSKVIGQLDPNVDALDLLIDTFPAGTLSGAPKYKAMELLNIYEPSQRGAYGGTIGYLGFDNTCKHAIMIRSFLSKNQTLYYQSGAGLVADSVPEKEVQEVKNKLMALGKAIDVAANK